MAAVAVLVHRCVQITKHKNTSPKNTLPLTSVSGWIRNFPSAVKEQSDRQNIRTRGVGVGGRWEINANNILLEEKQAVKFLVTLAVTGGH